MKKNAFTMIELIFVIVILGILAVVSLPKFIGVSDRATATICKGYYGTLSRAVAPAIWSDMQLNEKNATEAFTFAELSKQLEFVDVKCGTSNQIIAGGIDGTDYNVSLITPNDYTIITTKVTDTSAPSWEWKKNTN